jgi:hypothetical protein
MFGLAVSATTVVVYRRRAVPQRHPLENADVD